jgi:ribosomal protein S18 acetylase RimI-like enzyme
MIPHLLNIEEIEIFIGALDEKPEHTVSIHQLRNDLARAWIIGKPDNFRAAIVQWTMLLEEPIAFGDDAAATWQILKTLSGWDNVQVSQTIATSLRPLMQAELHSRIESYDDIYYMLQTPLTTIPMCAENVTVRLLNPSDIGMVKARSELAYPLVLKSIEATLCSAVVAGAIVDGKLVGFAESREANKHVELGVYVDEAWRKQGIASALAGLLIQHFQPQGLKIIWATGSHNNASQRVAEKLGFREVLRRVYLIPQRNSDNDTF